MVPRKLFYWILVPGICLRQTTPLVPNAAWPHLFSTNLKSKEQNWWWYFMVGILFNRVCKAICILGAPPLCPCYGRFGVYLSEEGAYNIFSRVQNVVPAYEMLQFQMARKNADPRILLGRSIIWLLLFDDLWRF